MCKGLTKLRDTAETVASLAGNYFLPGSSLVTDRLVSKGSQKQLGSTLGQIAQGATGLAGGGVGESFTGIPSASEVGAGWSNLGSSLGLTGSPSLSVVAPSAGAGAGGGAAASAAPSGAVGGGNVLDTSSLDNFATKGTLSAGSGTGGTGTGVDFGSNATGGAGGGAGNLPSVAEAAAKAPTSVDNFLAHPGVGAGFDVLKANPSAAINAAGLGLDLLKGQQPLPGESQLKSEANSFAGQGQTLSGYLQSGTLPPGVQQGLTQATEAAKATIRSQYAAKGMSGSSAEQQDLAAVDNNARAQGANMAMQLLNMGISETGMASQLYKQLMDSSLAQDKSLGSSISSFASSLAGGKPAGGTTITVGGA